MSVPPDSSEPKAPASPENTTPPNNVPKPDDTQGLKRFIQNARQEAKRGGDVNVANIGDGAQVDQIAVGRNILQAKINIGALVVPVRFLLALLAVILVLAVAAWFYFVPATMPPDTTNIAVATFGQQDAQGNFQSSAQGQALSQWLYGKLQDEKSGLPENTKLTVWNDDRMTFLDKRVSIGRIDNEAQAAKLADDLKADMVIFGDLDAGQNPATFVPQFYVRQEKREADELTGAQPLGANLKIDKPVPDLKDFLEQNLQPRAQAVLWFARGIGLDALGEYGKAYQLFCRADVALPNWSAKQGREILYYFMGREALFAGRSDDIARATQDLPKSDWGSCAPFNTAADATDAAQQWFEKSKSINADYARGYFGLGQAHAQRANRIVRAKDHARLNTAQSELAQAIQNFKDALVRIQPGDTRSLMDLKAHAALGSAHILMGQTFILANEADRSKPIALALPDLQRAEAELEPLTRAIPPDQTRFLAQTFLTLGTARQVRGQAAEILHDVDSAATIFTAAAHDFSQCLEIGKREPNDEFLTGTVLPLCTNALTQVNQALGKLK